MPGDPARDKYPDRQVGAAYGTHLRPGSRLGRTGTTGRVHRSLSKVAESYPSIHIELGALTAFSANACD